VANAGADASKVVARIASGYTPPSGPATPEVGRLAQALSAFGDALAPIGTDPSLLPQLSLQLQRRAEQIVKKDPQTAGRLVNAKQQVDSVVQALPRLRQAVAGAASRAGDEASKQTLSAQSLDQAIRNGADSATTALNGVNQAIDAGVAALSAAA
jgi:ABC-type transporter Mla subunit MlaD